MIGHSYRVDGDRLRLPGVSFGYGDSDPYIVAREGDLVVIRVPSHKEWLELGHTKTYPSCWMLIRLGDVRVEEVLVEVTPGRFWQHAKSDLLTTMRTRSK